jgi:cytochrome c oxidase assembly protein subunit 15
LISLPADARAVAGRASRLAAALAAVGFCLVVLGALVRAHGAGLACPDWPLCFGELVPRFDFHVAFEWGHRALAGTLALGCVALAFFTLRTHALRARVGRGFALLFGLLGVQIVLGGLTVLLGLAPWTVTAHLLVGNTFVVTLAWLASALGELGRGAPVARTTVDSGLAALGYGCAALLVLQLALGGLVASHYAGLACASWPLCNGDSVLPTLSGPVAMHALHRLNGYALAGLCAAFAWRARGHGRVARLAVLVFALVLAQIAVGIANVLLQLPVEITGLHSALAAALALSVSQAVRELLAARANMRESVAAPNGRPALEGAR